MRVVAVVMASLFLALVLPGCLGAEESSGEGGSEDEGLKLYRPINRPGIIDLIPPYLPPHDVSPACQALVAADRFEVLDLSSAIVWDFTSERTRELRLSLVAQNGDLVESVEGPSPLNLSLSAFGVGKNAKFGMMISLVGESPVDRFITAQEVEFYVGFVAEFELDQEDAEVGRWGYDCP